HDNRRASTPIIIRTNQPTESWCDTELAKRLATDPQAADDSGVGSRTNEKWRGTPRDDPGERLLVISILLPQRIRQLRIRVLRDAPASVAALDPNIGEFFRARDRQVAQTNRVDQFEDGRVDPDDPRHA